MHLLKERKWDTAKYLLSIGEQSIDWEIRGKRAIEVWQYTRSGGLIHFICESLFNGIEFGLLKRLLNAIPNEKRNAIANQRNSVWICLI